MPNLEARDFSINPKEGDGEPHLSRTFLSEVFPQDYSINNYMLGITAVHGNEPLIMCAAIGDEINSKLSRLGLRQARIVLPSMYGARTGQILREEFPDSADNIFLSEELGEILKKTEFGKEGYNAHLQSVALNQPQVQHELLEFLSRPFRAQSLLGNVAEFEPGGKKLDLNAGANVVGSSERDSHFVFPVKLSDLLTGVDDDPEIHGFFDSNTVQQVQIHAEEMEQKYRSVLIPYVHTFSFKPGFNTEGVTFTPPLKKPRSWEALPPSPKGGVYIMISGSEVGREATEYVARKLNNDGHEVYHPSWMNLDFGKPAMPDALFHSEIRAVMGRMGWGIGWMSQVARKPFIATPHLWFDNPEIHFNIKSIEATGIGMVFEARPDLIEKATSLTPNIEAIERKMRGELGIDKDMNGITFSANEILRAEYQARTQ